MLTREITGATEIIVHLGDPIAAARAPSLMNDLLMRRASNVALVPHHVRASDLTAVVRGVRGVQNIRGGIVSMPHKIAVVPLLDRMTATAAYVGACNVFRISHGLVEGTNLDGEGFVAALQKDIRGSRVFIAGAGGVATGIAFALAAHHAAAISILNRSSQKAMDLVDRLNGAFPRVRAQVDTDPAGHDIVINATALGMNSADAAALDTTRLSSNMIVAEAVINEQPTTLLREAEALGCRTQPGLAMLVAQIPLMADFILD